MLAPVVFLLLLATLIKNGDFVAGSGDVSSSFKQILNPTELDMYFAGPSGVNNAIGLKESWNQGYESLLPDILQSMPVLNHYIDAKKTTIYTYNLYLGRLFTDTSGDQIIPTIGQGAIYFGYFLSPIISILFVLITCWSDKKYRLSSSYYIYLYGFISVWAGVQTAALNMTIFLAWVYIRILPFAGSLWLINRLARKKYATNQR